MRHRFFIWSAIVAGSFLVFSHTLAATGFVSSPLFLSPDSPKAGQTVTLSALFYNENDSNLSGTILFYDGTTLLGKKSLIILPDSVGTAKVSFVIAAGDHSFSADMETSDAAALNGRSEVTMADVFVPVDFSLAADAASSTAAIDLSAEQPIIDKINATEATVLSFIPVPIKQTVANIVGSIDAWRAKNAVIFSVDEADDQAVVNTKVTMPASNVSTVLPKQAGTPATVETSSAGFLTYVSLALFTALAFLFSVTVIFYLVGIFLAFIVLRFIFRKIARLFHKKK